MRSRTMVTARMRIPSATRATPSSKRSDGSRPLVELGTVSAAAAWTDSGPVVARVTRTGGTVANAVSQRLCSDLTVGPPRGVIGSITPRVGGTRWTRQTHVHPNLLGQMHWSAPLPWPGRHQIRDNPHDAGSGGRLGGSRARSRLGLCPARISPRAHLRTR